MTEDEAKQKWCPWANARLLLYPQQSAVGGLQTHMVAFAADPKKPSITVNCVGSACMAWRATPGMVGDLNDASKWTEGYCGNGR